MVKFFSILLALVVALAFGGVTFAKSLGNSSSVQSTFPLGTEGDKDDADKKDEGQKMKEKEGDEEGKKDEEKK